MSQRELKALLADKKTESTVGNRSGHCRMMSDSEEQADLDGKLQELKALLVERDAELQSTKEEVVAVKLELEQYKLRSELESLRAMEALRTQHAAALERERKLADAERQRTEDWLHKCEGSWYREKENMECRLAELEGEKLNDRLTVKDGLHGIVAYEHGESMGDDLLPHEAEMGDP